MFDLLYLDGKDLRDQPLLQRKAALEKVLPKSPLLLYTTHVVGEGVKAFNKAKRAHEEGVIAKLADGLYTSDKRSREWLKAKASQEEEVVVVGFTKPRGSRKCFGALVLAVREGRRWKYAGRVGTGFDEKTLHMLYGKLVPLITRAKPIETKVPDEANTSWVKPKLVVEVKFTEWTKGGDMRHPVYLGLRTDKPAAQVVREVAKPIKR